MLNAIKKKIIVGFYNTRSFLIAKVLLGILFLLMKTCRIEVKGLEAFVKTASEDKCILMLWHNRLASIPFILKHFTPTIQYAAVVSGSRDGDILSKIICSFKQGHTIRVPHLSRYEALRTIIGRVKEGKEVVVITPDGPRGPCYEVKPGIAIAALETQAHVVGLDWKADSYWKLNTWDKFRIPKPFSKITVSFTPSIQFNEKPQPTLEEAKAIFKSGLPS